MTRSTLLCLTAAFAVGGCSETEIRPIYESPVLYEQPDALGPTWWTDEFQQRTVEKSDILFVVDDSCSMEGEQAELASNFDNFIQSFVDTELDYHIGVTRAALAPGQPNGWGLLETLPSGGRWIDPSTTDPVGDFNEIANVGTGGGDCEMALEATFSALTHQSQPGAPNDGFYREDALLTAVLISDEIDHGADWSPIGGGCGGITPSEFLPWWRYNLKGPNASDDLIFTAIVGDRPNGCSAGDGADFGAGYWDVLDGLEDAGYPAYFQSVCAGDWSDFLLELGYEAAGLRRSFRLRRVPLDGTLSVTVDGAAPTPGTWSYNRVTNAVDFPIEHIPDELAIIEITYQLLEDSGSVVSEQ